MRLGLALGYASPGTNPTELVALAQEAERLGYDSAWTAEAWGTDAVTVLAWLGATTTSIKLGTGIMQIPARTPAMTAMTAATLDLMSGGRVLLGLGTSGPQVVEGWHGQPFGKPLGRTREYVEIVRAAIRRELLQHTGAHYEIPYAGGDATGLGIPLKLMLRPVRTEIPVYLAAIGPRNVALATEIADGWLPVWASPEKLAEVFGEALAAARPGFDVAAFSVPVAISDDLQSHGTPSNRTWRCTSAAWARRARTTTTPLSPGTATGARRPRSRSSTSAARRWRRSPPCPTHWSTRWRWSARATGSRTASTPGRSRR